MRIDHLRQLARTANYVALSSAAQTVAVDLRASSLEKAVAHVLWGYSLVRLDVHRNAGIAFEVASRGAAELWHTPTEPADWALLVFGMCHQVAGDHAGAERVFRQILTRPISPLNRAVCAGNLATTLSDQGFLAEAAHVFAQAGNNLDQLPTEEKTPTTTRERQRIRLNLTDCLMQMEDFDGAAQELDAVDVEHLTPLLRPLHLICLARLAMRRDSWDDAWTWGQQAHSLALEVGYPPFREAALGVLVAVSGRNGRLSEQRRLVQEMASLIGTKGG